MCSMSMGGSPAGSGAAHLIARRASKQPPAAAMRRRPKAGARSGWLLAAAAPAADRRVDAAREGGREDLRGGQGAAEAVVELLVAAQDRELRARRQRAGNRRGLDAREGGVVDLDDEVRVAGGVG